MAADNPGGLAVDEEWPAICMQGAGCLLPGASRLFSQEMTHPQSRSLML
jgi:hypothetical protein